MRFSRAAAVSLVGALALAATPAPAAHLAGRVTLTQKGKPATDPGLDARRAVVWYVPEGAVPTPPPRTVDMATVRKQFSPQLVAVPVGSTVRFPNQDPILHNVFSVSGGNTFDLGLVGAGKGKQATFKEAGVVRVFCNVHHAMFGHVVVVATPFYGMPETGGAYRLSDLPAGRGTLWWWHERGEAASRAVTLPHAAPVDLRIEVTRPRVPPHKNKFGKSYSGRGYG
jgi:hypothetical protein